MSGDLIAAALREADAVLNGGPHPGHSQVAQIGGQSALPLEVFPEPLQNYIRTVAASTETPVDAVAFSVFEMLSACYGTHIQVRYFEGYTSWCHDYGALVAPPALGKTPLVKHTKAPLREIERELQNEMAAEVREAQSRIARLEADRSQRLKAYRNREGAAELETDLQEIDAEIEELRAVTLPQLILSDVTPEVLVKILSENEGAGAMVSAETPLFARLVGRASGKPPDLEAFLSGYDGEFYRSDRITRGSNHVEEMRLAINVATQGAILKELHARPELVDRGLIARFTFCVVEPLKASELSDHEVPVTADVRDIYVNMLRDLGLLFRRQRFEPFELDDEAKTLYRTWRNLFKRRHKVEGGDLCDIAPFARKLENKVLRWAGLLHPLWTDEPGRLTESDIERALLLVDFAIDNSRAVDSLIADGPVTNLARSLATWLHDKRGQTIKLRDVRRHRADYRRATEETRKAALEELEADGVVKLVTRSTGGRPSPVMEVMR